MRAMWIAAGFGVLAIGMVLGVVVSGFTPGAEAAPPEKGGAGGRLITLLDGVTLGPSAVATSQFVATDDCVQVRLMWDPANVTPLAESLRTSPDGVVPIRVLISPQDVSQFLGWRQGETYLLAGTDGGIAGVAASSESAAFPFLRWQFQNSGVQQAVSAWAWCSFH